MTDVINSRHPYSGRYTDLLDERVGGRALACSDEWFAECTNLVKHADPIFREGHFVDTGQWMDGWESRRSFGRRARLASGVDFDWCTLQLGIVGVIHGVDIETTHFKGNAPEFASLEGAFVEGGVEGEIDETTQWHELVPHSATAADAHNLFAVSSDQAVSHVRLKMFPDGGVARLRTWGEPHISEHLFESSALLDLASVVHGGRGILCNDMFYSSPSNLLMPQPGINMGDGWETRRRRDSGHDWCVIKLGLPGMIKKVIMDTAHFKGNYPDRFSLEVVNTDRDDLDAADIPWQLMIDENYLEAHREHIFEAELLLSDAGAFSHVRLNIFPDGGVSRLRVLGTPAAGSGR